MTGVRTGTATGLSKPAQDVSTRRRVARIADGSPSRVAVGRARPAGAWEGNHGVSRDLLNGATGRLVELLTAGPASTAVRAPVD
jgi:hypothetical protein